MRRSTQYLFGALVVLGLGWLAYRAYTSSGAARAPGGRRRPGTTAATPAAAAPGMHGLPADNGIRYAVPPADVVDYPEGGELGGQDDDGGDGDGLDGGDDGDPFELGGDDGGDVGDEV